MHSRRKRRLAIGVTAAAIVVWLAAPTISTAVFLLDMAGAGGTWRTWIPFGAHAVSTENWTIASRHGPVPVRIYRPDGAPERAAVVVPGVHGGGVDEPRLAELCRRLAATGMTVVCAPLPELREFIVTARSTDQIEDVTRWAADNPEVAASGRVGLVGVSFGGGLSLVAAGRPTLAERIEVVVSIGGYGDLSRVLRYLCTGALPDGTYRTPHDYGLAVVAYAAADRLVPPDQAARLARGIRTFLEASLDDSPGQPLAARLLSDARAQAAGMPEPARRILQGVIDRDHAYLGQLLAPLVDELAADPALSPERRPATRVPVFLLHGQEDNVIPSSETPLTGQYLRATGNRRVTWLLTPLLTHARMTSLPNAIEAWRVIAFWRGVFAVLE
jgi:dienelactone hydrolase